MSYLMYDIGGNNSLLLDMESCNFTVMHNEAVFRLAKSGNITVMNLVDRTVNTPFLLEDIRLFSENTILMFSTYVLQAVWYGGEGCIASDTTCFRIESLYPMQIFTESDGYLTVERCSYGDFLRKLVLLMG